MIKYKLFIILCFILLLSVFGCNTKKSADYLVAQWITELILLQEKGDYQKMKNLFYKVEGALLDDQKTLIDTQNSFVDAIKNYKEDATADNNIFGYNKVNLIKLRDNYLNKCRFMNEEDADTYISFSLSPLSNDQNLKKLGKENPANFIVFDEKGVKMIFIKGKDNKLKMCFGYKWFDDFEKM